MRRAKIVCTLGPATDSPEMVATLIGKGMSVARLNLSHADHAAHQRHLDLVREAAERSGQTVAVLADLQGPKIRLGTFETGFVLLSPGDPFRITTRKVAGTSAVCSTTYSGLPYDVAIGDTILVDDGHIEMEVVGATDTDVDCRVIHGGRISDHKGINLPQGATSVPALSDKDVVDLAWALRAGVDIIALSFVRTATDLEPVRAVMAELGISRPVVAKIEKPQAVANLEAIIEAFDGIMIARGDLGVEVPLEQVPLVQKRAIALARAAAKPVIVATQMLDSMVSANRPTRAEASDVANAVLDGADALMLSQETSIGEHPALVVETMARIIEHAEEEGLKRVPAALDDRNGSTARAITRAACEVGAEVGARYLVSFTETGETTRMVARHRSRIPSLAFAPLPHVRNYLALVWGVRPFAAEKASHTDQLVEQVDSALLRLGIAGPGDKVVIIAGVPPGVPGTANGMRVHPMGSGAAGLSGGRGV